MNSNPQGLDRNLSRPNAGPGVSARILRLVKSAPERQAIASGQVDAVIDPATGAVFLLPAAQQALNKDRERMHSLLALSADWCWEQDENYRFVSHTATTAGNSAPYEEGLVGKLLWDLPFDNMQKAGWDAHRKQLEWRVDIRDLDLRCTDGAGETRWVSISAEPLFDEQDQFKGYRGITRDITLRKWFEALAQLSRDNAVQRLREEQPPGLGHEVAEADPIANSLLAALPRKDYRILLADLESVTLTYGEVLYEPGERIRHVYFPNNCLISLLTTMERHQALEVGLVGWEGMIGISLALGIDVSNIRALVQGTGTALRMSTARFRKALQKSLPLQDEVYRFTHAKLAQARQTAACNRFHMVEARLARWLLMTGDRMRSDQFLLTQAFLADMLGVRRVGVTEAAMALQRRNLITYTRGKIRILDREGLETVSCACYKIFKDIHDRAQAV
jgi:CRP-like cAMP-binding protein/PAS domain-containing protein